MPSRAGWITLAVLLLLVGLSGCGKHVSPPSTVPVTGLVTLDGKAIAGVRVTLHPQFSMGRVQWGVVGETDTNGRFVVGTGAPGNGAPPGKYVVTFTKPEIISDPKLNGVEVEVDAFNDEYSYPDKSDFMVIIKNGDNVLGPFELKEFLTKAARQPSA